MPSQKKGADRLDPRRTSSEYFQSRLLQWAAAGVSGTARIGADHARLVGVKPALTRGSTVRRLALDRVTGRRRVRRVLLVGKRIAALGARRKNAVNQVGRRRRRGRSRAQVGQVR